jgi:acyl carrier protein
MQDIKRQVRAYLLDNFLMGGCEEDIADDTSFMEKQILDSTGFIELVSFLEETFGVTVEDEEMIPENLDSLPSIEQFIARKRSS